MWGGDHSFTVNISFHSSQACRQMSKSKSVTGMWMTASANMYKVIRKWNYETSWNVWQAGLLWDRRPEPPLWRPTITMLPYLSLPCYIIFSRNSGSLSWRTDGTCFCGGCQPCHIRHLAASFGCWVCLRTRNCWHLLFFLRNLCSTFISTWQSFFSLRHLSIQRFKKTSFNPEFKYRIHSLYLTGLNIHVRGAPGDIHLTRIHYPKNYVNSLKHQTY